MSSMMPLFSTWSALLLYVLTFVLWNQQFGEGKKLPNSVTNTIVPISYDLELFPDIYPLYDKDFRVYGNVSLRFRSVRNTTQVALNSDSLDIQLGSIRLISSAHGDDIPIASVRVRNSFIVIKTQYEGLVAGSTYTVALSYSGEISKDIRGLFYSVDEFSGRKFALTHLHPDNARRLFPCVDHPAAKAVFTVKIWRKPSMASLSNGEMEKTNTKSSGERELECDVYEPTPPMSTYLLALAVHPHHPYTQLRTSSGVKVRIWTRPSLEVYTDLALTTAVKTIEYFTARLDQAFPLRKLDMFVTPDLHAAGMENWGLITLAESNAIYDPATSSDEQKASVVVTVSHEVAHQWFGDLVTHQDWEDIWITEGAATFMSQLCVDAMYPELNTLKSFLITKMSRMMRADVLSSARPVKARVTSSSQLNSIFDMVTYVKGGALFHTIHNILGAERFWSGVKEFLEVFKHSTASVVDWLQIFQKHADNVQLETLMTTLLEHSAYPHVDLDINSRNELTLQFSENSPLPLNVQVNNALPAMLHPTTEHNRLVCDKERSYLRLNVSSAVAERWTAELLGNHKTFSPVERYRFLDDLYYFSAEGDKTSIFLRALAYLGDEDDPVVLKNVLLLWMRVLDKCTDLYKRALIQDFIIGQFGISLVRIFDYLSGSWMPKLSKRDVVITAFLNAVGHRYILLVASERFERYINNPQHDGLDPELVPIIGCSAMKQGSSDLWRKCALLFRRSALAPVKMALAQVLVCTTDKALLRSYLDLAKSGVHLKDEADMLSIMAAASDEASSVAFDYLLKERNEIKKRFGYSSIYYRTFQCIVSRASEGKIDALVDMYGNLDESEARVIELAREKLTGSEDIASQQVIDQAELNRWIQLIL